MMSGNAIANLRTPNMFVRKLITFLFFVPFILINGDIGVYGHNNEIAARTLSAPNLVHSIQMALVENEQHSSHRRRRRQQQQQQHIMPESGEIADGGASPVNGFQPNNTSSATERNHRIDNEYRNGAKDDAVIENRDDSENSERHAAINKNGEKILSRRRRYLIFPPGSSVQIVFDSSHPILGYSNYMTLGITAALAWELPYKPVYLNEELHESYQMGNLPLIKRKDQNVSKVNYTSTNGQPAAMAADPNAARPSAYSNYYYTNVPPPSKNLFDRIYAINPNHRVYYNMAHRNDYANNVAGDQSSKLQYYLSYADKFMKEFKELTQKIPKDRPFGPAGLKGLADTLTKKLAPTTNRKSITKPLRRHFVHPVFKRESIDKLDELDKHDLNLHRTTRHKLYQQIETFMKTQGSDGMECVLKTLCETGQRDTNEKPGSMIVELLRAVFTLPEGTDRVDDPRHRMYDRAHQSKRNCHEMFPACAESVWGPKYQ